jgi:hypothetical protein
LKELVKADTTDYGALRKNFVCDLENSYTINTVMIRGLSTNREENDYNFDYYLEENQQTGIKYYQHKYFCGLSRYYNQRMLEKEF